MKVRPNGALTGAKLETQRFACFGKNDTDLEATTVSEVKTSQQN